MNLTHHEDLDNMDLINQQDVLIDMIIQDHNRKLDEIAKEGLRLKGFEFNNDSDLIEFISKRCSCIDYSQKKRKVYYIDGDPFLVHDYEPNYQHEWIDGVFKMKASGGKYSFL